METKIRQQRQAKLKAKERIHQNYEADNYYKKQERQEQRNRNKTSKVVKGNENKCKRSRIKKKVQNEISINLNQIETSTLAPHVRRPLSEEAAEEEEEEFKVLDVHKYFENFKYKPEHFGLERNTQEYLEKAAEVARRFHKKIRMFRDVSYSEEYVALDLSLEKIVEEMDKIRTNVYPSLLDKKSEIIRYIQELHQTLDSNLEED